MTQHDFRIHEEIHNRVHQAHRDDPPIQPVPVVVESTQWTPRTTLGEILKKAGIEFEIDHPVTMSAIRKAVDILVEAGF